MAGVTRVGAEFQVNTDTTDFPAGNAGSVIKMVGGGFMIVWTETNINKPGGMAADGGDIRAQIFSSTGAKVGSEFVVNTTTTGMQILAKGAQLADGTIFIAWSDDSGTGGDASGTAVKGQFFSTTGAKVGGEILVNTNTNGAQNTVSVGALTNGNVLVSWVDSSGVGGDNSGTAIKAQIMTPAGVKVGGEILVNSYITGSQLAPKVVGLTNGNFIVTWTGSPGSPGDASGSGIRGQMFDATGTKIGGEFPINTNSTGNQTDADVSALLGGGFVVAWHDLSGTLGDANDSIKAQVYDATGTTVGAEFLVNTQTGGNQTFPSVVTLDNGDFVITWVDRNIPGVLHRQDLRGQLFSATGVKIGLEFVADSPTAPASGFIEGSPAMVAIGDGKFVVASGRTISGVRGEYAQILAGSRDLAGTTGNNALVGAAGADTIMASPGTDTVDGRGGSDIIYVNGDDRSLFALTTGSVTYTLSNNVLTNSLGTLNTTLTSVERLTLVDTSAANHMLDITNAFVTLQRVDLVFGNGNDTINGGRTSSVYADLGLGNNTVIGRTSTYDGLVLTVGSGTNLVTVNDITNGITVGYSTAQGSALNTITYYESITIQAAAGMGLRVDASASSYPALGLVDSPYDDVLIGSRGNDILITFSSSSVIPTDLSGGTDYKYGNGGADDFDYSVAFPLGGGDHIMDLDSDDYLDFSYYQGTSQRSGANPTFIGTAAFTGTNEREIRYEALNGKTYIYTDSDGDGITDGTVIIENGAFGLELYDNGSGGETVLRIALSQNFFNGTDSGETLGNTTQSADVVRAYGGNDTIAVSTGQDFVDGGAGNDTLLLTTSNTTLLGALPTGSRTYTIGADRMVDSSGTVNTSFLSIENFTASTIGAGDFGDTFDAHLFGGTLTLTLGNGNDTVTGTAQADSINGGGGNDRIDGGAGADTMTGGMGNDTYVVDNAGDVVVELSGEGTDTVESSIDYTLGANLENLTLTGTADLIGTGNSGANVLRGNSGINYLYGGGGTDTFYGGLGDDVYIVDSADDVVIENANEGTDLIKSSVSYTLAAGSSIESLRLSGSGNINATGNADFNKLVGNPGDNILDGGGGGDVLRGGLGNDTYVIRDATDRIVEVAGNGTDMVKAAVSYALEADAAVEQLLTIDAAATTAINLTGNAYTSVIQGNAGANILTSGSHSETLTGFGGADIFKFLSGNGQDAVGDFVSGTDKLDLSAFFASFAAFQAATSDVGGNAVVNLGGGNSVTLTGVLKAQIQTGDVIVSGGGGAVFDALSGALSVPGGAMLSGDVGVFPQSAGDDIVDLTAVTTGYGTLDGGAGTDTLRLNPASPQTSAIGPFGAYLLSVGVFNIGTTLTSFERFVFNSTTGNTMTAQFAYGGNNNALNQIGSGLAANSEIVGGAGNDSLTLIYNNANLPGTVTAPVFTLTNWTTPTRAYLPGDRINVAVSGSGATTIYGTAHTGVQGLTGGSGNDTIYGSDDMDFISGGSAGADQLHGGGGDDTFSLTNTYTYSNGFAGAQTTRTGAGTLFDGGAGTDFLQLGGTVNFQGTLQSIEGLFLAPQYLNTNSPTQPIFLGSQYLTIATFTNTTFAGFSSNLELDGQGAVIVKMGDGGETFSGAGFVYDPGAEVYFEIDGGNGNDQITGTESDDLLYGKLGNDTLSGGGGDDEIQAGYGNDIINGGDGDDLLFGEFGNDTLTGGLGADEFRPGLGFDVITDFTKGVDLINLADIGMSSFAQFAARSVQVGADLVMTISIDEFTFSTLTIRNTTLAQLDAADFNFAPETGATISGSDQADLLYSLGGDFAITFGNGGDDIIVSGPASRDRRINGDDGNDTVILSDQVASGLFLGGNGFDTLSLRARAATSVTGNTYNFSNFFGASSSNSIDVRGFEALKLESTAGTVFNVNFDMITYDMRITTLIGGAGTDIVTTRDYNGQLPSLSLVNWGEDDMVVFLGSIYSTTLNIGGGAHPGLFRLVGSTANDTLTGSGGRDQIEGGDGNDMLYGGAGTDTLYGGIGADQLDGGAGADTMYGGAGDDTYVVDDTGDVVVELAGEGTDIVLSAADFTLGANVENLTLLGSADLIGTGNSSANVLRGNSGNNYLYGGGGTDTFYGGLGDDVYIVDSADDVVFEGVDQGNDLIKSSVSYTLAANSNIESLRLAGTANINATGDGGFNKLVGNTGDNILDGGGGGDVLRGGLGNDTYIIRDATDRIVEVAGNGTDVVKAAVSYVLEADAAVEQLLTIDALATTAINLTGNAYATVIQGNAGANVLTSGSANETLTGFGGADTFKFLTGNGQDHVGDFVSATDKLDLSAFFASFAAFQAATTDVGGNAVVTLGGGNTVTLDGVLKAQIQSGDVIVAGGGAMVEMADSRDEVGGHGLYNDAIDPIFSNLRIAHQFGLGETAALMPVI